MTPLPQNTLQRSSSNGGWLGSTGWNRNSQPLPSLSEKYSCNGGFPFTGGGTYLQSACSFEPGGQPSPVISAAASGPIRRPRVRIPSTGFTARRNTPTVASPARAQSTQLQVSRHCTSNQASEPTNDGRRAGKADTATAGGWTDGRSVRDGPTRTGHSPHQRPPIVRMSVEHPAARARQLQESVSAAREAALDHEIVTAEHTLRLGHPPASDRFKSMGGAERSE
jgi:hypothetical protein